MTVVAALLAGCLQPDEPEPPPAARTLSADDYDRWRQPDRLVGALGLAPGDRVADVGAGRGYLTGRLAAAVGPTGRVVATEIDPDRVADLSRLPAVPGSAPIEVRLVQPDQTGLEPGGYELVLLAQVDHLFADRVASLRQLAGALSSRGRLAVSNRVQHRARLLAAARAAGLAVDSELDELPGQFLVLLSPTPEVIP